MNDETNQILHEFMGGLEHRLFEWDPDKETGVMACNQCLFRGPASEVPEICDGFPKAYDSESSPRTLLAEVEAKVIEKFGEVVYWRALCDLIFDARSVPGMKFITATAHQRATACRKVIEGGKDAD